MSRYFKRLLPLALLVLLTALILSFDLHSYLTLKGLRDNREALQAAVTVD
jgi:hypothetical protein